MHLAKFSVASLGLLGLALFATNAVSPTAATTSHGTSATRTSYTRSSKHQRKLQGGGNDNGGGNGNDGDSDDSSSGSNDDGGGNNGNGGDSDDSSGSNDDGGGNNGNGGGDDDDSSSSSDDDDSGGNNGNGGGGDDDSSSSSDDDDSGGNNDDMEGDPHMKGLRGQRIDWSGVDGGWYSMIKDDSADLHINIRLTAPLPKEFPDRQLITGLSILSEGHSLAVEVKNPYTTNTNGCPKDVSPCLANGGLRVVIDGTEVDDLLRFSRDEPLAEGVIAWSATNLPVECRQFGGDKIWARMHEEMLQGRRMLSAGASLEEWILGFHKMAAPEWCIKYVAENDLADLQSTHAIFKIDTPTVTVRLNAGVNSQGGGELDWNGRVLPDLDFWQMDIGLAGLDIDNPTLSGILGETARPVYDEAGREVMEGFEAFRGDVEDYRVSSPLGTHFALLDNGGYE